MSLFVLDGHYQIDFVLQYFTSSTARNMENKKMMRRWWHEDEVKWRAFESVFLHSSDDVYMRFIPRHALTV